MPDPTHFFVPCAGANTPKACKHNVLVPLASFFDEQALASVLQAQNWTLFVGEVDRGEGQVNLPKLIYFAFCPACSALRLPLTGVVNQVGDGTHGGN
jgi:hypothetical protein